MAEQVKKVNPLTDKMKGALAFLQANEGTYFCSDIAEAIGSTDKSLSPVLTSLVKRELIVKTGTAPKVVKDKNGNDVTREYAQYALTEAGKMISLD